MPPADGPAGPAQTALACVTGRFQPLHEQHLELFEIALGAAEHLIVAVTNPDTGALRADPASPHRHTRAANPFTYDERARLVGAALAARGHGRRHSVVPFDLERSALWAQCVPLAAHQFVRAYDAWERVKAERLARAGYRVTVLDGDAARRRRASDIREHLRTGDGGWRAAVPPATVPLIESFLAARPLDRRA